ncbi:F exclusion suppressor [Pseudoalteromonas luteoviolacea]|nr:F exclusion suppressor [Pseudoalteromonas luteoviolacea]
MFKVLFLLFIVVPIVEIALLIQISDVIGGFATIALVIATAILGAKLVKQQGLGAYSNVQRQMASGQLPGQDLFTGLCVIIAGVFLMTPGIMTDALGFMLLTPMIRQKIAKTLIEQASVKMQSSAQGFGQQHTHQDTQAPFQEQKFDPFERKAPQSESQSNTTIEGEYQRKD